MLLSLALFIVWFQYFVASFTSKHEVFPTVIPAYEVRKDLHSHTTVTSGLVHTLPPRATLAQFRKHLQCSLSEPNLNYNNGLISALRLAPPTSLSIKQACVFIEGMSDQRCKWSTCKSLIDLEAGNWTRDQNFNVLNNYSRATLLRVINGSLFLDWPWGIDRFDSNLRGNDMISLMKMTLERITDMRDSVFFVSGDQPSVLLDKQSFPIFCYSTAERFADLVWPWNEMHATALKQYKQIRSTKQNFTNEAFEKLEPGFLSWEKRLPKAALYATMFRARQFLFDVARLNPDLIDARWTGNFPKQPTTIAYLLSWNPASREWWSAEFIQSASNKSDIAAAQTLPAGYILPLVNISGYASYQPGRYKYVVVPLGQGAGLSTSGRLHHILATSGAVVLLQSSSYKFHFSAQFKPWVHYVPLTFSGADLAEKVRWLREHDDLARQIAENGRNFARSYLRLEDYYCYAASALEMMAELTGKTDAANVTFSPRKITVDPRPGLEKMEWPQ